MNNHKIILTVTSLYLIIIYPVTYFIYQENIYYPGCSGMGCVVGNMMTGFLSFIGFLILIVLNFIFTRKLINKYAPQYLNQLTTLHLISLGTLLLLFYID